MTKAAGLRHGGVKAKAAKPDGTKAAKPGGAKARSTTSAVAETALKKVKVTKADGGGAGMRASGAGASGAALYACLHGLLHTMRLIERQEEHLCAMQDEMKRTGRVNAAMRRQLQTAVEELPVGEYAADVAALRRALVE